MNLRRGLRTALIVVIASVQLLVPALALRHVRPGILGWHMFVSTAGKPRVTLLHADGREERIDIDDVVVRWRPEIDFPARLTPELCDRNPDLEAVRYQRDDGDLWAEVACER